MAQALATAYATTTLLSIVGPGKKGPHPLRSIQSVDITCGGGGGGGGGGGNVSTHIRF